MANGKLVKWIVGATSVLAFTGFVGMAKDFDSTLQDKASASDDKVKKETKEAVKDPVKDEFFGSELSQVYKDGEKYQEKKVEEKYESKKKHHDDDDDDDDDYDKKDAEKYNNYDFSQDSGYTQPAKKYRSRAS